MNTPLLNVSYLYVPENICTLESDKKKLAEKKTFFIDEFFKKRLEQHYEILRFPLKHLRSNRFRIKSGKISSSLE